MAYYPTDASSSSQAYWGSSEQYPSQDAYGYSFNSGYTPADQQSIYTPENVQQQRLNSNNNDKKKEKGKARTTVLRHRGGKLWEDQSLLEWDPSHFRLFVGDLGNDVTDDVLKQSFSEGYPSFVKAKVVRDKFTTQSKGYGFVAYSDPEDFLRAWKEKNNTHVGSRPVKIQKASTPVSGVNIGKKKARQLDSGKKASGGFGKAPGAGITPGQGRYKPYIRR